jgi:hypothetical protein
VIKRTVLIFIVDTNCDGEVDLSEYLTYILFEHQEREIMYDMSKPIPYPNNPREFTLKNLSLDLYIAVIARIVPVNEFLCVVSILSRIDSSRYSSRSNRLYLWTISIGHPQWNYFTLVNIVETNSRNENSIDRTEKTVKENETDHKSFLNLCRTLPLWITCMCVLPDLNSFAVATTERDLIFYDLNSHVYSGSIVIQHFPANLTTLDYRMDLKNAHQSSIFCGDALGNLFVVQGRDSSKGMFHISDLAEEIKTGSIRTYSFPRMVNEEYSTVSVMCFCHLHEDWIAHIKWIDDLDLFVSCTHTSKRSLFIGDLSRKTEKYAAVKKGFGVLDYCKV